MKRPLALIGLTVLTVLTVCFYSDGIVAFSVFVAALLMIPVTLIVKKLRKMVTPTVFLSSVLLSVVLFTGFTQVYVKPLQSKYSEKEATVCGIVTDEPEVWRGRYYYNLKVKEINEKEEYFRLLLDSREFIQCKIGDELSFECTMYATDYEAYYADRAFLYACVNSSEAVTATVSDSRPLYYHVVRLREAMRSAMYQEMEYDVAALSSAVLLGDKSGLSNEISASFRAAGMSHLSVVSGLHLSIIVMLYKKSFGKLLKNRIINGFVMILLVLFFLALTGFGKSTIRSAIMVLILIFGEIIGRESDSLTSLGIAALVLCIPNPYVVGDVGVLLSFSATFGIITMAKPLNCSLTKGLLPVEFAKHKIFNKVLRKLSELFACTFSAAVATFPVTTVFFGRVSLVQIITNILVAYVVEWFMLAALGCAVLHFVYFAPFLADIAAFIANGFGYIILLVAEWFSKLSIATANVKFAFVYIWIVATFVIFFAGLTLFKKKKQIKLICVLLSLLVLLSGNLIHFVFSWDDCTLYVTPTSSGVNVLLSSKDGNAVISCSGKSGFNRFIDVIEGNNSSRDLVIVSSTTERASENACEITSLFDYKTVLMYDTDDSIFLRKQLKESCEEYIEAFGDKEINLWNRVKVNIVERVGCVYILLECDGVSALILPQKGDINHLPDNMKKTHVLIASDVVDNMEMLDFDLLVVPRDYGKSDEILNYHPGRECEKIFLTETFAWDIAS